MSKAIADTGGYLQCEPAFGHTILKNYISNKTLFETRLFQATLGVLVVLLSIMIISGVVVAQNADSSVATSDKTGVSSEANADSFGLNVYRPYLVKITDDGSTIITSTVHRDAKVILADAGFTLGTKDRYTLIYNENVDESLVGIELYIDRATPVKLNLRGVTANVLTQGGTVEELLEERHIALGPNDVVVPTLSTVLTPGVKVSIHKVGTETVTVEEDVDFTRTYIDDPSIAYGTDTVKTPGVKGRAKVTYKVTYSDDVEASREKINSETLKEAVVEVIIRGTKGKPASNGPLSAAQIQFLGGCESGMTATRNSGNGYYGAFQFSTGTWNAMGTGYARADLAPLDVQIQAVQQLLSRSSIFGQFPGCANAMVSAGILSR